MTVSKKWFFLVNNEVQGPYSDSEIEPLIQTHSEGLIWGQGFAEWVRPEDWKKSLTQLQEVLSSLQSDLIPQWRIRQDAFEAGPFIYDQLIQVLKAHPDPAQLEIFQETEGWKSIYSYPTIVEEVGITRRNHERVPISGLFRFEKNGHFQDSLLATISEGGLSVLEAQGLSVGDQIKGSIQSPQLPTSLSCTCEVLYKQTDGSWGMRFMGLPFETKSLIVAYAQKFSK